MAGIDLNETLATLKRSGPRTALIAVATTIGLGVADQFTGRIIPTLTAGIENFLDPPSFILRLSAPATLAPDGIALREIGADASEARPAPFRTENAKLLVVRARPGNYILVLRRTADGVPQELREPLTVKESGQVLTLDTGPANWASVAELDQPASSAVAGSTPAGAFLIGTRWTTAPADFAGLPAIEDRVARSALAIALAEVGTNERGGEQDLARIRQYWSAVPGMGDAPISLPWSAAFIAFVIERAGLSPPPGAAAGQSWRGWGQPVPAEAISPGMVAVFARPGAATSPARLTVGIVVRRRPDCTEIIAGNIADRVVITCVSQPPIEGRWPSGE